MQVMGVQLDRYVPAGDGLADAAGPLASWEGEGCLPLPLLRIPLLAPRAVCGMRSPISAPPLPCAALPCPAPPAGVVSSEDALRAMLAEFVLGPLWRHADKLPGGAAAGGSGSWQPAGLLQEQRGTLLAAAAAVAAVGTAVLLWRHRSAASSAPHR